MATRPWTSGDAEISACDRFRFRLRRWRAPDLLELEAMRDRGIEWRTVLFVMLNPSTATPDRDDHTIRKVWAYADLWGFHRLVVVNLFPLRATAPADLWAAVANRDDGRLAEADRVIGEEAAGADLVVLAYGTRPPHPASIAFDERVDRVRFLLGFAGREPYHLRENRDGTPAHPARLPGRLPPVPYLGP